MLEKYITWLKAHEKLIIICLGLWFAFHLYGDVLNTWTEHDKRQIVVQQQIAQTAQQKVQADAQATSDLIKQLADLKLQYASLSTQVQSGIVKRQQDTNAQKQKDDSSIPSELSVRIAGLIRVEPKEIVSDDRAGTLTMSSMAGHANINALEDGIAAEATVIDLNKLIIGDRSVIAKQDDTIVDYTTSLSDEKKLHQADVELERKNTQLAKDEGKKKFRSGFKWGYIAGFGTAIALKVGHVLGF